MSKKRILVICPGAIYPIQMGSQVRMFNLIKGLSSDHIVDVIAKVPSKIYLTSEYINEINNICDNYFPILSPNGENNLKRGYYRLKYEFNRKVKATPAVYFYNAIIALQEKICEVANSRKYDIINYEYWFSCVSLNRLTYRPYFAVDTNDVFFEKCELELKLHHKLARSHKNLKKLRELELKYVGINDLIISVSEHDYDFFRSNFPDKYHIKIPIGQELNKFLCYKPEEDHNEKILFYGNMSASSVQNIDAFWILYYNIFPKIKRIIKNCQLYVVGANPSEEIKQLSKNSDIIVTGFVNNVEETLSQTSILILPLRTGAGFRTRVVEVMALGIPVIGTHNALDSLEIENGVHGYVTDSPEEMAEYAITLLNNPRLRKKIGAKCRKFVSEKFSVESTYGKLSEYYSSL